MVKNEKCLMSDTQIDFQKTLNLPKTEFGMRAGLVQKEPKFLEQWEKADLYEKIKAKSADKPLYTLHDGPPYANGNIHIGHALNKILKDFIIKAKTMQGYKCAYTPGWDCHGLPIEHQLLKEMKKKKSEVDCVAFRKKAHDYAMKYVGIQTDQFKRLGVFGQWDDPYLTLDKDYEYWIVKSLARLQEDGYVYRGLKPVNWCPSCETALAEAEVEYEDHHSPTVFVKFKVTNPQLLKDVPSDNVSLLIWTTTPWTLPANVAVAVYRSFEYSIIQAGDDVLIIEKTLAPKVLEKAGISDYEILKECTGDELTGLQYEHPFGLLEECKVVAADYVTKEDGTGLVHTAPGHGQDDFQTGKKYGLKTLMPVNERGVFTEAAGDYAGQYVFKANKQIIADLQENGQLLFQEQIQHSYPHCWRCKNAIIFRATDQWFMSIDFEGLRGKLKQAIDSVTWIPQFGRERITSMVAGRPDWCLSRQRYWGVPIPALKPLAGDQVPRLYPEVLDYFAQVVRKEGSDAWFEKDVQDLIPQGFTCPETGAKEFEKTYDILDVWFDSGVSHQSVLKGKLGLDLPVDMYLEGSDQHRGWFQSSLIPAVAMEGKAPYKEVLTHGFVVDGSGRKMSKSLGNVISPLDIIKKSGADIIRLWVAASSYNEDVRISDEILARMVDAYRKIRNTFRYLLGNLYDFDPDQEMVAYKDLLKIDQWALHALAVTSQKCAKSYDGFQFSNGYKAIYAFCNEDLSNFYLEILKDRLYTSSAQGQERKSAQTVLFHMLNHLVRLMAPILSFTTEEVFAAMPKTQESRSAESVHMLEWLPIPEQWDNVTLAKEFDLLIALRPYVMRALEEKRKEDVIGSSLDAKIVFETASERDFEYLTGLGGSLPDYFVVSQAEVVKTESVDDGVSDNFSQTRIIVKHAEGQKCSRSWKYTTDVGADPDYPTLSLKSAQIVKSLRS